MTKKLLAEAYRRRQGIIGVLGVCKCAYPIEPAPTTTKHAVDCQAHAWLVSMGDIDRAEHTATIVAPAPVFSVWRNGDAWTGRCRECGVELGAATVPVLARAFAEHMSKHEPKRGGGA